MTGCEQRFFLLNIHFCNSRFSIFNSTVARAVYLSFHCSKAGTDMTDYTGELASPSKPNSAAPLLLPASDERRAPTAILSSAKRTALIACLNGGSLHKLCGVWAAPSADAGDKPIAGVTIADLRRDGMLILTMLRGSAYARLTARGNWFAQTVATELAERAAP
jgi:hypothetical protein